MFRDPRDPEQTRRNQEELARQRERRRAPESPEGQLYEELWTELFGNRRIPNDVGRIGRIEERLDNLERLNRWLVTLLITTLVGIVVDVVSHLVQH